MAHALNLITGTKKDGNLKFSHQSTLYTYKYICKLNNKVPAFHTFVNFFIWTAKHMAI